MGVEHRFDGLAITQIALDKLCRRMDRTSVACEQIVKDDHLISLADQLFCHDTTDIACATRNENLHGFPVASFYHLVSFLKFNLLSFRIIVSVLKPRFDFDGEINQFQRTAGIHGIEYLGGDSISVAHAPFPFYTESVSVQPFT
jgi:hypothetical protein